MADKRSRARAKRPQKSLPAELIAIVLDSPIGQTIDEKLRQIMGLPQPDIAKIRTEAKGTTEKIKSTMGENPYKVLGVDPDAEEEVVKAAYKAKARLYHPDPPRGGGSNRKMAEINQAYDRILKERKWRR